MKGQPLTKSEIEKIKKMINARMKDDEIAFCIDRSPKTVQRVRLGHYDEPIQTEGENENMFIGAILANQREIIELLNEVVSIWRK